MTNEELHEWNRSLADQLHQLNAENDRLHKALRDEIARNYSPRNQLVQTGYFAFVMVLILAAMKGCS